MIRAIFGKRSTTKADVVMAIGAALVGLWKAYDTVNDYKTEQEDKKELSK